MKHKYEQRIDELTKDIITLVNEDDPVAVFGVKTIWKTKIKLEELVWFGSKTITKE